VVYQLIADQRKQTVVFQQVLLSPVGKKVYKSELKKMPVYFVNH